MTQSEAKSVAIKVAAFLKERGASKVVLFGSVVTGKFYPDHSDIDLYVEGIPPENEAEVIFDTFVAFSQFALDLIPESWAPDYIREEALSTGLILFSLVG